MTRGAPRFRMEERLHGRSGYRLVRGHIFAVQVAGGEDLEQCRDRPRDHSQPYKHPAEFGVPSVEQVKSSRRRHDERTGDHRTAHGVHVGEQRPGIGEHAPETGDREGAVRRPLVGHRMLHPRIGRDDEESGQPRAEKDQESGPPVTQRPRRFSPKRNMPRNADSRKNENTPSIATGWAMTPPVNWEKRDQLVPNWNSMGMPVTTPARKLMPKILVQKRAAWSYTGLPPR